MLEYYVWEVSPPHKETELLFALWVSSAIMSMRGTPSSECGPVHLDFMLRRELDLRHVMRLAFSVRLVTIVKAQIEPNLYVSLATTVQMYRQRELLNFRALQVPTIRIMVRLINLPHVLPVQVDHTVQRDQHLRCLACLGICALTLV
jgi:hypothetical protein